MTTDDLKPRSAVERAYEWCRRNPVTLVFTVMGIAIALVAYRGEDTRMIITRSACVTDPSSQACAQIRKRILRNESQQITCIAFHNVGYVCPKPRARSRNERNDAAGVGGGGSASGSQPQSSPAPAGGGGSTGDTGPSNGSDGSGDTTPPTTNPSGSGPPPSSSTPSTDHDVGAHVHLGGAGADVGLDVPGLDADLPETCVTQVVCVD